MTAAATPPGLDPETARARLLAEGANELPQGASRGIGAILAEVLREPMLALLLAGGAVYLLFGDPQEAAMLLVLAVLSILITVVQESRSERMLSALRDLTAPQARVLRGGQVLRIPGRELVRGDVMLLAEGERIAADARLLRADDLVVDESLLTGESVPVGKIAVPAGAPAQPPGGDGSPFVWSGALVVRGAGLAEVTATGPASAIGRIGGSLASLETEPPRLRAQTLRLVRIVGILGGVATLATVLLYGLGRGDWLQGALAGIALGMSMLPEEFPVVLTVFMAMGAWRISQARVLTRRAAAIESLGAATVLCTDKTGTLTQNRMRLREIWGDAGRLAVGPGADPHLLRPALVAGSMASAPHPVDPMDAAFHAALAGLGDDPARPGGRWSGVVQAFGLTPGLMAVTQIWQDDTGARRAAAKGAPEAIAQLCRLTEPARQELRAAVATMAEAGLRVLGLATADLPPGAPPPGAPQDLAFTLVGLVGLADPLRDSAAAAVAECRAAGIRVVMITGDHPLTARAIATEAGLPPGRVLTGEDLTALPPDALAAAVAETPVFARVQPDQKLAIVQALKSRGEIVAMTGDGVNDAPSLKAAHIGIAMGGRGTDVAREAAAIVLLDDDFTAIVQAVRLGRRIFDNLRKAMGFIVAVHLPVAGVALLPLLLGTPIIFTPIHIAFLEMIIDPVCALVFEAEPEETDTMRRPPRPPQAPLFSAALVVWALVQGAVALAAVVAAHFAGQAQGLGDAGLRGLTFLTLVLAIFALIQVNRSFATRLTGRIGRQAGMAGAVPLVLAAALLAVFGWAPLRGLFGFAAPGWAEIALAFGLGGVAVFVTLQAIKALVAGQLRV